MIFKRSFFILLIFSFLFSGCDENTVQPKPPSNSINKIMNLGASRVEGFRPNFESYRFELWKDLIENSWVFDYVGTRTDGASYPPFKGEDFDTDHEGRGGFTSGEILDGISGWLNETGAPDIVLFSSPGGNDILDGLASFDETVSNIHAIIDILQERNPNVTIIIEELAPGKSSLMTPEITANFEAMQQEVIKIAIEQTTSSSQVLTVDMHTGFTDAMLADDVHYNEAGADFIATRYFNVLINILEQ